MAILFLYLNAGAHAGQDTLPYRLQHFDNSSGLPQNSVNAIGTDRQGYIWLATENGLVRYDGRSFRLRPAESTTSLNQRFLHIFKSIQGELLAMNYNQVFVRIADGKIIPDSSQPLSGRDYADWVVHTNKGDSGRAYDVRLPNRIQKWGSTLNGLQIQVKGGGQYKFRNDTMSVLRHGSMAYQYSFRNKGSWKFFLLDSMLYFLGDDGRTARFGQQPEVTALSGDITENPEYRRFPERTQLFWDHMHAGEVLMYTGKTFYVATKQGAGITTRKIFSGFDVDTYTIVAAMYNEDKGQLYLGSASQGLFILTRQRFTTRHVPEGFNSHYSLLSYGHNQVLSAAGFILGLAQPTPQLIPGWKQLNDFYSASLDGSDGIWSKGYTNIYHYNQQSLRRDGAWELPSKVTMLHTDRRNRLWIGLQLQQGVWMMDGYDTSRKPYKLIDIRQDPTCFAEDGNRMYIGTDGGFYVYNTQNGLVDSIVGLNGRYVRSAKVMASDEVWISTYGQGFYLYKDGRLSALPLDSDRFINYAHCIFADRHGYFWIPTNTGLFQVRRTDLLNYITDTTQAPYFHYYDKFDGLATNEFNGGCQPCAAELRNGFTALPSLNGVVFFHPDSIRPILPALPVFLDEVLLNNVILHGDSLIRLPEEFSSLQLAFSSPYMGNRKNLQLQYALIRAGEQDTVWSILPDDGRLHISTLPSGGYQLIVRKPNGFGPGNYSRKTVLLEVAAPWYESRWFYLGILLTGIVATMLVMRFRSLYVDRKNTMLKALVDDKTRELKSKSALQEKIIQSVGHNVLTPLKYQYFLSRKIHEQGVKEEVTFTEMARVMNEHTNYLYHMVDNLLKYLKSQMADRQVADKVFEPSVTADAVLKIFRDIAQEKSTVLVNSIPEVMQLHGDELLLSVILHNLTDNAVKVTRGGQIVLDAYAHDGGIVLSVQDTGPGVRTDIAQWFNAVEVRDYPGAGGGIGLLIVKELAQTMGLHVAVTSDSGKGSVFTIWFPGQQGKY